jgi:exosortase
MLSIPTHGRHWGIAILGIAFAVTYGAILIELARDWIRDDNYSHGFIVIPVALYLAWNKRATLSALPTASSATGVFIVAASLAVLLLGTAGLELFLMRVSMLGVLAGSIVFLCGWGHVKALSFPLAFLLLMIPLPALIFNEIAFPLQLLASQLGVIALQMVEVPVLREGNVIVLVNSTLEVAEACSGIRSLVSLLTLALLFGYFTEHGTTARVLIALSSVPAAIVANSFRVAATGAATHYYGTDVANTVLHGFSGWVVFIVSCGMIVGADRLIRAAGLLTSSRASWQETRA